MTASPAALLALATECEAANGPSRELDARVWVALDDGSLIKRYGIPIGCAPKLTASVDAVLGMLREVLPGWGSSLWSGDEKSFPDPWCDATIWRPVEQFVSKNLIIGRAPTLPLAIVAALLRAVAAQKGEE